MSCTAQSSRPRGAPEAFARRVLGTAPAEGLKIEQILDKAGPPEQRAMSRDAVRISLRWTEGGTRTAGGL